MKNKSKIIIGLVIGVFISVLLVNGSSITSHYVKFDNSRVKLTKDNEDVQNVQDAIDALNIEANNLECKVGYNNVKETSNSYKCRSASAVLDPAIISCSDKYYNIGGTSQEACSCSGGTIGGVYSAANAGVYTATCTGDDDHSDALPVLWEMHPVSNDFHIEKTSASISSGYININNGYGYKIRMASNSPVIPTCQSSDTTKVICNGESWGSATVYAKSGSGSVVITLTKSPKDNNTTGTYTNQLTINLGNSPSWTYGDYSYDGSTNNSMNPFYFDSASSCKNNCNDRCSSIYNSSTWSCIDSQTTAPTSSSLTSGNYCWCYH